MAAKSGTSIAASIVAGAAALLRGWAVTRGGLPERVLLSVLGNGVGEATTSGLMYGSTRRATGFGELYVFKQLE